MSSSSRLGALKRCIRLLCSAGLLIATSGFAADFPAHYAAPYLQIDTSDTGDITADMKATGDKFYTLAFLTSSSGCNLQWEAGGSSLSTFVSSVNALQSAGGNVIISFGGAGSTELAQSCTSVSSLTNAYSNVVNTYGVNRLDFDIEGDALDDTAANDRRNKALAALQAKMPSLKIDYTVPVNPDGLPGDATKLLQNAISNGVQVNLVNIMTMDFGDGENALNDALSAAQDTAGQLASLYGISTSQAYAKLGLTPIAGQNDDNEFFSLTNAQTLESFASSHGVQELSFWEVDGYDKGDGYAYSSVFNAITGGSGGNGVVGSIVGYGGLCIDVQGANSANSTPVQVYTCNGTSAQAWTVAPGQTLQALGKCMGAHGGGTADGTVVDIYACNGTGGQVWQPQSNGALYNPQSGKCLDDTNWATTPGTQLQIWSCSGNANQVWSIPH